MSAGYVMQGDSENQKKAAKWLESRKEIPRQASHYEEVLEKICAKYRAERLGYPGLKKCISAAKKADLNPDYVTTFLIALKACRIWYANSRREYDSLKLITDGNSRYASENSRNIAVRNELNKFERAHIERLLIIGYMERSGAKGVSITYLRPIIPCLQKVFNLRGIDTESLDKYLGEEKAGGSELTEIDIDRYRADLRKEHERRVSKNLWNRANNHVKRYAAKHELSEPIARKKVYAEACQYFQYVHSIRTGSSRRNI